MGKQGTAARRRQRTIAPTSAIVIAVCGIAVALGRATRRPHFPGEHTRPGRPAVPQSVALPSDSGATAFALPDPSYVRERADLLSLTPEQRKAVAAIDAAWRADKERMTHEMLASGEPDRAPAERAAEVASATPSRYRALTAEFESRRLRAWSAARGVLTPDQRRALDKAVPESGAR